MMDPDRVWRFDAALSVNRDVQPSRAQFVLGAPIAHLHEQQPGESRGRAPIGNRGKAPDLLEQFHHVDFGGHRTIPG